MSKTRRNRVLIYISVFILLFVAWLCRIGRSGNVLGWIRCSIQCLLIGFWAYSIRKRIINPTVQRYLISIAVLYILWTIEVMTKYTVLYDYPVLNRYAWYLYYIPMTIVPVLLIYIGLYVDKPFDYRINRKWYLLLLPAIISIIFVITNNYHQLVFRFPNGVETDEGYKQTYGFFVIITIMILEIGFFIAMVIKRCRLGNKTMRLILPVMPLVLLVIYGSIYIIDYDLVAIVAGDMKTVNVYVVLITLEICISTGLLPSNTRYKELFMLSSLSSLIVDKEYNSLLSSSNNITLPLESMMKAEESSVKLDNDKNLFSMPIKAGHVLWVEDDSEVSRIVRELEELDKELEGKNLVLHEEYETNKRKQSLIEKNRLYNQMQEQTKEKIIILKELINQLKESTRESEIRLIVSKISVITAYLKRRNNLIFISEENGNIPLPELSYCLKESLNNLSLFGGDCDLSINLKSQLKFKEVALIYDMFELVIEKIMTTYKEIFVSISLIDDFLCL